MNKENVVTLSLSRYDELRDFEKNIKEGKFAIEHINPYQFSSYYEYFSEKEFKDRVVDSHKQDLKKHEETICSLNIKIKELEIDLKKERLKRRRWWG